jgi:hypothetical protein
MIYNFLPFDNMNKICFDFHLKCSLPIAKEQPRYFAHVLLFHLLHKQSGLGTKGLYGLSNYGKINGGWMRLKV